MILKTLGRVIFRNADMLRSMKEVRLITVRQHKEVLEAIRSRDITGAARAMTEHLNLASDVAQSHHALSGSERRKRLAAIVGDYPKLEFFR